MVVSMIKMKNCVGGIAFPVSASERSISNESHDSNRW